MYNIKKHFKPCVQNERNNCDKGQCNRKGVPI